MAWSPTGDLLAGADGNASATNHSVFLWTADGIVASILNGHSEPVTSLDWSADGSLLASGSEDGTVRLWDSSGNLLHRIDLAPEHVFNVAWSPDGKLLAVATIGGVLHGTVRLYSPHGQLVSILSPTRSTGGKFFNLAWSANGSILVGGAVNYAIWHRDGTLVATIDQGGTPAWGLAVSSDGSIIVISDENGDIALYDVGGNAFGDAGQFGGGDVFSIAFAGSSHVLAAASTVVRLIHADPTPTERTLPASSTATSNVVWSPHGHWLAVGMSDQTVRVWDVTGAVSRVLTGCPGTASVVGWSPDGHSIVALTDQRKLCGWHWAP